MGLVSLIVPLGSGRGFSAPGIERMLGALEGLGVSAEVIGVCDPRWPDVPPGWAEAWKQVVAEGSGLASAAAAGLEFANGDVLVFVDPARGYGEADVARVAAAVLEREAELVLASRKLSADGGPAPRLGGSWIAGASRRLVGSTDPFSGLLALSRGLALRTTLDPVGSLFAVELLGRARGRRLDVPVADGQSIAPHGWPGLDELRALKRLADHRFGNASRLVQFCMVGASGMVVDLSCYALFQWVFARTELASLTAPVVGGSLSLAAAGAVAIALALTWNFLLNRRLTFNDAYRGSIVRQFLAYALSNALGIALSFSLRLMLPNHFGFFARHKLAAAVVGIVAATGITFSLARWLVFARRAPKRVPSLRRDLAQQGSGGSSVPPLVGGSTHLKSLRLSESSCEQV